MKKKEYILHYDMVFGNLLSVAILFFMIIFTWVIVKLTGVQVFNNVLSFLETDNFALELLLFYILMFAWMMLHEVIHAIAYQIGGANPNNIVFGIMLEKGVFYCKCREYVSKKCIMFSLLAPFFTIGVITYIAGFFINSSLLIILSIINICGASCDLMMFLFFLKQKNDIEFKELGFSSPFCLRTTDNLENKKFIGIKSISLVKDEKETFEPAEKKLTISKFSLGFCGGLIILLILLVLLSSLI